MGTDPNPEAEAAFPSLASATGTAVTAGSNGGWAATAARARSLPPPPSRPSNRVQSLPRSSNTAVTAVTAGSNGGWVATAAPRRTRPNRQTRPSTFLPTGRLGGGPSRSGRAVKTCRRVRSRRPTPSASFASSPHTRSRRRAATARLNPTRSAPWRARWKGCAHGHDGRQPAEVRLIHVAPLRASRGRASYGAASVHGDEPRRRVDYRSGRSFRACGCPTPPGNSRGGTDGDRDWIGRRLGGETLARSAPGDAWFPGFQHHSRGRWSRRG